MAQELLVGVAEDAPLHFQEFPSLWAWLKMASLKFFCDAFSQPCRAVLILLEANKIPYELVTIKIAKGKLSGILIHFPSFSFPCSGTGEQRSDEYKKVNPTKKVPAIDDGGYKLYER